MAAHTVTTQANDPLPAVHRERLIRIAEVIERTGLSRSSIYLRMKLGTFPPSVSLGHGGRAVRWTESSINDWIQQKIDGA